MARSPSSSSKDSSANFAFEAAFGLNYTDSFRRGLHPDLRADYVLTNPPLNDSDWFRKKN